MSRKELGAGRHAAGCQGRWTQWGSAGFRPHQDLIHTPASDTSECLASPREPWPPITCSPGDGVLGTWPVLDTLWARSVCARRGPLLTAVLLPLQVLRLRHVLHQAHPPAGRHHRHRQLLHLPDQQEEGMCCARAAATLQSQLLLRRLAGRVRDYLPRPSPPFPLRHNPLRRLWKPAGPSEKGSGLPGAFVFSPPRGAASVRTQQPGVAAAWRWRGQAPLPLVCGPWQGGEQSTGVQQRFP